MQETRQPTRLIEDRSWVPNASPICSVCIANYNGEQLLTDCIESILEQRFDGKVEIVVHDDASSDNSVKLLHERYPSVIVIESKINVGYCVANNRMAVVAKGDFLLLLNNDAALLPGALATLHNWSMRQPCQGITSLPQYDWDTGALVDRGCRLDPFCNAVPNLDTSCIDVAMVIGACLWIPRKLWFELGGFPAWYESISEDVFLCCSARLRGYPVQVATTSGYRHRQGASFGGNKALGGRLATTYRRRRLSERNKTFNLLACTPATALVLLLPLHIFLLAMEGAILTLLQHDLSIWRRIYWPVVPALFHRRKEIVGARRENFDARQVSTRLYFSRFVPWPHKLTLLVDYGLPKIR